jgi:hypothetical protein
MDLRLQGTRNHIVLASAEVEYVYPSKNIPLMLGDSHFPFVRFAPSIRLFSAFQWSSLEALPCGFQYKTSILSNRIDYSRSCSRYIFFIHALPKLESRSSNYTNILFARLRLQVKEVAEKIEVGLYA